MLRHSESWGREALLVCFLILAAFAVGLVSESWRPSGYAQMETLYLCSSSGDKIQPQQLEASNGSEFYFCGAVSGNVNWNAGMYISHNDQTLYSTSVQLPPGAFRLAVPLNSSWPFGPYKVEFIHAQKLVAKTEFEIIPD
jgi:hypothetical protein